MNKLLAAPFPYFGGKRRAAPIIWRALGDPSGYVEPFAGSAAVLLARPQFAGRRVETLNDADGWLVNAWRAIQLAPDQVAAAAYGPVTEIDYHARLAWLQERRSPDLVAWLEGDPECFDAKAAGWWLYVVACGIGNPFDPGPWRVINGLLTDTRELPHLGDAGQGINRELPHLGDAGMGINRELPHLGDPEKDALSAYLHRLAQRLTRVRITCGSWERVVKPSVTRSGAQGDGSRALFLDPPYDNGDPKVYAHGGSDLSHAVREWCLSKADPEMRIVLCGYDDEHAKMESAGWAVMEGRSGSGSGRSKRADNGRRERLWLSPACLSMNEQGDLFAGDIT